MSKRLLSIFTIAVLITLIIQMSVQPSQLISLAYAEEKIQKDSQACVLEQMNVTRIVDMIMTSGSSGWGDSNKITGLKIGSLQITENTIGILNLKATGFNFYRDYQTKEIQENFNWSINVGYFAYTYIQNEQIIIDIRDVTIDAQSEHIKVNSKLSDLTINITCANKEVP